MKIALGIIFLLIILIAVFFAWFNAYYLVVPPLEIDENSSRNQIIDKIDKWFVHLNELKKFNGLVLMIDDGIPLLSKGYGFTNYKENALLNEKSCIRLASVSKQFTAAGVLRLAEMGLLDLDDPVAKHLEGFLAENVTVRHLLNQTSGIPGEYMTRAQQHRKTIGDVLTIAKVVELVAQHSDGYRLPGEVMKYSNTNYVLLAGVIEAASGKSYEKFMSEELFQPLGMRDTRVWNLLSGERSPNQADDFDQVDEDRTPIEATWLDGVAGDGAVFSSLHDFVIWDRFWYGSPLVSDALLREAFERPELNGGAISDYGFGWVVEGKRHWHNGAWLGANTYIARYPGSRCCLVVLDNSSNLRLGKIANEIEGALEPIFSGE